MSELIDGNIKFSDAIHKTSYWSVGNEFCFVEICQLMNHFISYIIRKLITVKARYNESRCNEHLFITNITGIQS